MFTRRQFLQLCLKGIGTYSLSPLLIPKLAEALEAIDKKPEVIWFEASTCGGNFFSFLNTLNPSLRKLLFESINLRYTATLMTAEGVKVLEILEERMEEGDYILIVEGTIPTRDNGMYGVAHLKEDGTPVTHLEMVRRLGEKAKTIIAAGTCAAFGGPYAAHPNPSGSVPVSKIVNRETINVSGCPVHPDWIVGTLSHVILFGKPELGVHNRPVLFFGENIHNRCSRRMMFENNVFASHPGEEGCLYLIGCKGPVTSSDCPTRQWSALHNSWPIKANTPCIGCVNADFPERSMPFFKHLPDIRGAGVNVKARTLSKVVGGVTALGIGTHFLANLAGGRLKLRLKALGNMIEESEEIDGLKTYREDDLVEMADELDGLIKKEKDLRTKLKNILKQNRGRTRRIKKLSGYRGKGGEKDEQ